MSLALYALLASVTASLAFIAREVRGLRGEVERLSALELLRELGASPRRRAVCWLRR